MYRTSLAAFAVLALLLAAAQQASAHGPLLDNGKPVYPALIEAYATKKAVPNSNSRATATLKATAYDKPYKYIQGTLTINNIANATMAHIHIGDAKVRQGPIGAWLWPTNPKAPTNQPFTVTGRWSVSFFVNESELTPAAGNFDTFVVNSLTYKTYLNVHTTAFPGGEIRGQVHQQKC